MNRELQRSLKRGRRLLDAGQYARAEKCFRSVVKIADSSSPRLNIQLAVALGGLGTACCLNHHTAEGQKHFSRAADILKRMFIPNEEPVQELLSSALDVARRQSEPGIALVTGIAEQMYGQGYLAAQALQSLAEGLGEDQPTDAEKLYRHALELLTRAFGPNHLYLAELYDGLAESVETKGDAAEAIRLYTAELRVLEKADDPESCRQEDCLWQIVRLHQKAGDLTKAVAALDDMQGRVRGDDNAPWEERTGVLLVQKASLYEKLHDENKALSLAHEAVELLRYTNTECTDFIDCLYLLGSLHLRRGKAGSKKDLRQALVYCQELLPIAPSCEDGTRREEVNVMESLAEIQRLLGKLKEADELYRSILNIRSSDYGPKSEQAANTMGDLAVVAIERKRYADARKWLKKGISILQKLELEPPRVSLLAQLQNLAYVEIIQRRFPPAIYAGERLLAVAADDLSVADPPMAPYLHNQAGVLALAGRKAEAEAMYARVLQVYEQNEPADHSGQQKAVRELQSLKVGRFRKPMKSFFYSGPVRTWTLESVNSDEEDEDKES